MIHITSYVHYSHTCIHANTVVQHIIYIDHRQLNKHINTHTHVHVFIYIKNTLSTRFTQHRSDVKKKSGTLVTKHFNQPNHTNTNLKCVVIEKVHSDSTHARLKRESFWMGKLQTLTPNGLNTKEEAPWER